MLIADAIAHAIDPPLLFSLHQQVEELEAILVEIQGYLSHLAGRKGTSGSSKKVNLGGERELVSSPPSFSGVISWGLTSRLFLSTHAGQMRCWKNWIGLQDKNKTSRHLVLKGFSRGAPKQWIRRWLQRCQNRHWGCPEVTCNNGKAYSAKEWRRRTAICGEIFAAIADGFPWRINCCPGPKALHLSTACWTSAVRSFGKLLIFGPVMVANARFWSFNPSSRSSMQFVSNANSSCALMLVQKVTVQRMLSILRRLNCNYPSPWIYSLQILSELATL